MGTQLAPGQATEQDHAFGHRPRDMDMKPLRGHRLDYPGIEHEVTLVSLGNQYPLCAIEAHALTASEKTFDLLVDAPHRQQVALGIERAGHGNALRHRHSGQRRQQCIELCT